MKFLTGPFSELNKVTWPTYRNTFKNVVAVIVFVLILIAFYYSVTTIWTAIMRVIEAGV